MERLTAESCFQEVMNSKLDAFHEIGEIDKGIHFVLYYLYANKGKETCSKDLSEALNVSTARMAALLNRLQQKEWILREQSYVDSRKTLITITPKGEAELLEKKAQACEMFQYLIDEIGEEELKSFMQTASKIKTVLERKG